MSNAAAEQKFKRIEGGLPMSFLSNNELWYLRNHWCEQRVIAKFWGETVMMKELQG